MEERQELFVFAPVPLDEEKKSMTVRFQTPSTSSFACMKIMLEVSPQQDDEGQSHIKQRNGAKATFLFVSTGSYWYQLRFTVGVVRFYCVDLDIADGSWIIPNSP